MKTTANLDELRRGATMRGDYKLLAELGQGRKTTATTTRAATWAAPSRSRKAVGGLESPTTNGHQPTTE